MATDPFRYPSSGPLLRLAFKWLVLDQSIDNATERKALDRFGNENNPEGVSAARRAELVAHLVEGLLGEEDSAVCAAVTDYLREWDQLAAALNSGSVKPETHGLRLYPLIRLAAFDLAIRAAVGALLQLSRSREKTLTTPTFEPVWLNRDAVTKALRKHHAGTWEELAGEEDSRPVQLIFRWREGTTRPKNDSLRRLANDLANPTYTAAEIERELRAAFVVQETFQRLDALLGAECVDELFLALKLIATKAMQTLVIRGPHAIETLRVMLQQGPRHAAMRALIDSVAAEVRHPGVRRDLLQLPLDWSERIRWWLQEFGDPAELAPRLAPHVPPGVKLQDIINLNRQARMFIGDPFSNPTADPLVQNVTKTLQRDPVFRANQLQSRGLEEQAAGNLSGAIELLSEAVRLDPRVSHLYALGAAWGRASGQKAFEEACKALRAALAIDPNHARVRVELGIVLSNEGQHEQAEKEFERAAPLKPNWDHLHFARGVNAAALGRMQSAEEHLRRALELAAARDDVRACLVVALERTHRGESAECRELRRLLDKRLPDRWREMVPKAMRSP